ncbi:DNA-processing protein DprA [Treponema parvum]|uniref:DNA-processing protein DprA n=1 Tax=Treponema parvum TaxID=138851 RepID=UPI001AEBD417|nr:DNA-processing protein DprA [Treponema parvum]QTQ15957.1 DNA-protecting protein DprA [Treponema parvum]
MQNESKKLLILCLSQAHFLTLQEKIILLKNLDSADDIALLSLKDVSDIIGRKPPRAKWDGKTALHDARAASAIIEKRGISYSVYGDKDYPFLLTEIPDAPFALFYRGDISVLGKNCVSVVGTRRLTQEGAKAAHDFAYNAVTDGATVVSGLAYGADGKAHEGAVDAFYALCEKFGAEETGAGRLTGGKLCGKTAAVLPCGIDTVIPSAHKRLASRILESGGCLLSEYLPGTGAEPWRFVQRNRIIAGLSPATVVIQAPAGSGALLTADFALGYDRDVLFHESALCRAAQATSQAVEKQLEIKVARGEKSEYKLRQTVKRYLDDGAPVIKSYDDYKICIGEVPGDSASGRFREGV